MKLNEGLVFKTKLDEEALIFLEKVIESFCLCLPVYPEISFLVSEKKSDQFIVVKSILLNEDGRIEINEGDIISYEEAPEARNALESGSGHYKENLESGGGTLFLPICKSLKLPICVAQLEYRGAQYDPKPLGDIFRQKFLMAEIYKECHSTFIIDPYIFVPAGNEGNFLNEAALIYRDRAGDEEEDWYRKIWASREGNPPLEDIIQRRRCTGFDYDVDKFQFFVIAFPLHLGETYAGMMISIVEISLIKNMLKEVISKSTIIKEVHHRVKNNLQTIASLLRLQTRRTSSYIVAKAFMESINRISSIALVYEALSQEGENVVDMKECIKNILSMIIGNMVEPNKAIKGEIRGQDLYLSGNQASNVSLCITELIQNALEHAFVFRKNGNIIVTLKQINREVIITVEDDGVGLSGKKSKPGSLGLEIIQMITTESLKGSFKLESHTYGSVAEIRFPM